MNSNENTQDEPLSKKFDKEENSEMPETPDPLEENSEMPEITNLLGRVEFPKTPNLFAGIELPKIPNLLAGLDSTVIAGLNSTVIAGMKFPHPVGMDSTVIAGMNKIMIGASNPVTAGIKPIITSIVERTFKDWNFNAHPIVFSGELSDLFKYLSDIWSKTKGYESTTFLPLYRILTDGDKEFTEEEILSKLAEKKDSIIKSAKDTLNKIDEKDQLKPLFDESIRSIEDNFYIAAQSLLMTIYGLIRDNRFTSTHLAPKGTTHILKSIGDVEKFIVRIMNNHTEEDIQLALMTFYVFGQTGNIPSDYEPAKTVSRHAATHISPEYFSQYNSLCMLLYVSDVFDFMNKLESVPKSLIKPKSDWSFYG